MAQKNYQHQLTPTFELQMRRDICNLGFGDLPAILVSEAFVVNKLDSEVDPSLVTCLRHWVYGDGDTDTVPATFGA